MNDFESFVRSLGLQPRQIIADGRWHRCKTASHPHRRNGAYVLSTDGRFGAVQDWATMSEPSKWRSESDELPKVDVRAIRESAKGHERMQRQAIRDAKEFYLGCTPLRDGHPYLESHGLDMTGCFGLRVDPEGWLVVPAKIGASVISVQRISPEGEKRFWPGAPISGTYYTIKRRDAVVTILCEGLATGLACFGAVPNSRVVVAFDTGNLTKVPVPNGMTVIAADNDHATAERIGKNPGIEAAQKAAESIGCGLAYPEGIEGSDWADYRMERLEARLGKKQKYDTRSAIRREVDSEIRRALTPEMVFVTQTRTP